MQNHKLNLEKNITTLREQGILKPDSIDFYSGIFDFQFAAYTRWTGYSPFPEIESGTDADMFLKSITTGIAVRELLANDCGELCAVIKKHNPGMDLTHLLENINSSSDTIDRIICALLENDPAKIGTIASSSRIGTDEFIFVIINWLKPFFTAVREKHYTPDPEIYGGQSCPFCGYYPDMGLYLGEKENKRYLHCQLCENTWMYRRLACISCGNEEKSRLEYFTDETNERYRIDACHECKGYIKSVKLNKLDESDSCDLTIENMLTLSLDAEMLKKGFKKL